MRILCILGGLDQKTTNRLSGLSPAAPEKRLPSAHEAASIACIVPIIPEMKITYNRFGIYVDNGKGNDREFIGWDGEVIKRGDEATKLAGLLFSNKSFYHPEPTHTVDYSKLQQIQADIGDVVYDPKIIPINPVAKIVAGYVIGA